MDLLDDDDAAIEDGDVDDNDDGDDGAGDKDGEKDASLSSQRCSVDLLDDDAVQCSCG